MKKSEVNPTAWFRIRASAGVWFLRTAMLFLALSAGPMPAAIGDDLADLPWRYTLKQPQAGLKKRTMTSNGRKAVADSERQIMPPVASSLNGLHL